MIVGLDARIPLVTGRGWGRYTCELVPALAEAGTVELRLLLPKGRLAEELAERVGSRRNVELAFAEFAPSSPDDFWEAARGVTLEGVLGRVDLLHSPTRFVLPTTIRPIVATVHDVAPLSDPPFKPRYRAATLRAIEYIREQDVRLIAVSEFTRHELATRAGLDVAGVQVIHHGVSEKFFAAGEATPLPRESHLLYVGGAGPNKNLERLIAAIVTLRRRHPVDLVTAGDRNWDHEELRRALGAERPPWIRLGGYVSDDELAHLHQTARACVFPSLHEGFGLPALEAMACGTPLACSRIPVLTEVAGDAAIYFDPLDTESIATAVGSLLDDAQLAGELAARGRARAFRHTWPEAARRTIEVYRRALEDTRPLARR